MGQCLISNFALLLNQDPPTPRHQVPAPLGMESDISVVASGKCEI